MKTLITSLLVLMSLSTFAGPRIVGNGGIGVQENQSIYMLDLYERGIHQQAYYAPGINVPKWLGEELTNAFALSNIQNAPIQKLVYKVAETYSKNFVAGFTLEKALEQLEWRLLDVELSPTEDTKTPLNGLNLRQVAVRQGNVVYISLSAWNQMDEDNRVALLVHEAFYYAAPVEEIQNAKHAYSMQDAVRARSVTGLIFTKRFSIEGFTSTNNLFDSFRSGDVYRASVQNPQVGRYSFLTDISMFPGGSAWYGPKFTLANWTKETVEKEIGKEAKRMCESMLSSVTWGGTVYFPSIPYYIKWSPRIVTPTVWQTRYIAENGETQWAMSLGAKAMDEKTIYMDFPIKTFVSNCQQKITGEILPWMKENLTLPK